MGLFDRLLGRKTTDEGTVSTELANANQETSLREQSSIEKAIAERKNSIRLDQCLKVSFGDVTALGTTFSQMIPALRTITISHDQMGTDRNEQHGDADQPCYDHDGCDACQH